MKTESKQLPLPEKTIEVKNVHGVFTKVDKLPTEGHVRITIKKRPSDKK